ncbi:probable disease resistance protein At4g33300 [Cryptomeria japonica]|uniref:probable disease resistance protein At4g33300 n=1 Tax=Cryptomeria japonica TaxID=3369 RepID=UPI0027DAAAF4|nr:probable disease resistance protein At4g33300 [Cryptomeria japonica]
MVNDSTYSHNDHVPANSQFYVGLEKCIWDLKRLLFRNEVSVVGVHSMGGGGKTTLALALCNDLQIKDYFDNNVIFITVSQSPNLKGILETMWEKIAKRRLEFQDVKDAHINLQQLLSKQSKPTLIILDDVWSSENLEELLFEGLAYKTLITSRDKSTIPRTPSSQLYQLPLLGTEDALSLLCFWAFGQTSIPSDVDINLIKEVQAECDGLPLALKVIGSSMHGELDEAWKRAKKKSEGEYISDYHRKGLFRLLQTSIDSLNYVAKECFLDLGLFPRDRKICVDALLDIWVYVHKLRRHDAFEILSELASKSLLNLSSNQRGSASVSYKNALELYFSQHNVLRNLALYLGRQDNIVHTKRLVITRKDSSLLAKGELLIDRSFDSQILSILTGPMEENHWHDMTFPETEALMLHFTSTDYFLPPFLESMKKLRFLMVSNCGTKKATTKGLDVLSSLTQLKSVRLERVIAPFGEKQSIEALQNLEKLSQSLCEGFGNISTFIKLQDFNLDHSSDLEELPPVVCNMSSILSWSITNCHLLQNLPHDFGNMSYLRMLRLSALPGLKELPASIGKLAQLEYLDISVCEGLKELPEEVGQLKKLREIDMRECSRLTRLPTTLCELSSLKVVTCDEKIGNQWLRAKNISIPELTVEIVEVHFSLDWLDD